MPEQEKGFPLILDGFHKEVCKGSEPFGTGLGFRLFGFLDCSFFSKVQAAGRGFERSMCSTVDP